MRWLSVFGLVLMIVFLLVRPTGLLKPKEARA